MSEPDTPEGDLQPSPDAPPKLVSLGASAGGLNALKEFFKRLSKDPGMTFVVVVHLSPEHESHLAELLQPHCPIPVQQVTETTPLEINRVYIIPPNAKLEAVDTHLRLAELEERPHNRATIDHFFRTLAERHDGHAIAIVLTGTGSDGTLGLRRIKQGGGVTLAQDPNEAEYDGMPRSAIMAGVVDKVLPVAGLVDEVVRLARLEPAVPAVDDVDSLSGSESARRCCY